MGLFMLFVARLALYLIPQPLLKLRHETGDAVICNSGQLLSPACERGVVVCVGLWVTMMRHCTTTATFNYRLGQLWETMKA